MVDPKFLTRRALVKGAGVGLAAGSIGGVMPANAAAKAVTIGFIYVGPKDDYGYNQAHAEGAAAIKAMPGLKVIEEERVPETDDVREDHAEHDPARRRVTAVPDQLRLLQPLHAADGEEIPEGRVPALRRSVGQD